MTEHGVALLSGRINYAAWPGSFFLGNFENQGMVGQR
jgi:hypothetical protein